MSTLKSETARTNGAKSKGPVTPQGQARSSRNAIKHGLTAANVCLSHENEEAFIQLRAAYFDRFQPADQPEADLVETMAVARWRLNRVFTLECQLLEKEMADHKEDLDEIYTNLKEQAVTAHAFAVLSGKGNSLAMLSRYEGQINRTYERALKLLVFLQSRDRKGAEAPPQQIQPNEPKLLPFPALDSPQTPPETVSPTPNPPLATTPPPQKPLLENQN